MRATACSSSSLARRIRVTPWGAAIGDQQDFIAGAHQHRGHQLAVALGGLDADHALRATALARVVRQRGALAVAVLGGGEDVLHAGVVGAVDHRIAIGCDVLDTVVVLVLVLAAAGTLGHDQADHFLAGRHLDATHAGRGTAHRADLVLAEAHGLAVGGEQQDVTLTVGQADADQRIALVQVDRDLAAGQAEGELAQRGLLDRTVLRGEEHELAIGLMIGRPRALEPASGSW
ncbi:hypothetical protein G6F31_017242 [Rhizopus arrhizus]|nr:hypothetical protein G6F31_017242 [Rhizopus arrhizus]